MLTLDVLTAALQGGAFLSEILQVWCILQQQRESKLAQLPKNIENSHDEHS